MNTLKDMAVLNIIKTDGKWFPEGKREGLELIEQPMKKRLHHFKNHILKNVNKIVP